MLLCTRDAKENMAAAAADPADDLKHALSGTSGGIPTMAEKHHLVSELWRILNYGGEEDIEVGSVLSRASDEDDKEDIRNWAGRPLIAKAKAKSRDVADMVLAIAPLLSRLNVYPGEVPRSEKTEKEAADAVVKVYNAAVRVCEEKAAAAKNKGIKAVSIKIPALERVVDLTARAVQCPGFGCGHPCAQPLLTDAALTAMNVIGEAAHKNAMAAWSGAGSTGPKPRRTGKSGHYTMAFVCQCSNQNCHGNRDGTGCVRCVANKGPFLNPDGQGPFSKPRWERGRSPRVYRAEGKSGQRCQCTRRNGGTRCVRSTLREICCPKRTNFGAEVVAPITTHGGNEHPRQRKKQQLWRG